MTSRIPRARSASHLSFWVGLQLVLTTTQTGCSRAASEQPVPSLELRSSSFDGETIPSKYQGSRENCACDGQDISPELSWNLAAGTHS